MTTDDPKPQTFKMDTYTDALAGAQAIFVEGEQLARQYLEANFPSFKEPVDAYARLWSTRDVTWGQPRFVPRAISLVWVGGWYLKAQAEVDLEQRVAGTQPTVTMTFDVYPTGLGEEGHDLLETMARLHFNVKGISWFPKPDFAAFYAPYSEVYRYNRLNFDLPPGVLFNLLPAMYAFSASQGKLSDYQLMDAAWPNRDQYFNNDFFGYQARSEKERVEWEAAHGPPKMRRTEAVNPNGIYRDEPREEDRAIFEDMYAPRTVVRNAKLPSGEGQWQQSYGAPEPGPIEDKRNNPESIYFTPPDLPTWENPTTYLND